jgi:hypothetical protein
VKVAGAAARADRACRRCAVGAYPKLTNGNSGKDALAAQLLGRRKRLKLGRSRVHAWGLFAIDTIDKVNGALTIQLLNPEPYIDPKS